jgi:hypothetical protein
MITATLRGKYEIERSGRTPRRAHYHQRLAVVATVEKPWHRPKFPGDWTNIALERCSRDHNRSCPDREQEVTLHWHLTIRLSDAGAQRQTKTLYSSHRPPPWPTEDATRDRSNRLLDACAEICSTILHARDLDNLALPERLDQRNAERAPE